MKANPLAELGKVGQSVWYDQMERALVKSGKLKKMIDEDDLRGLTSNPTIFEKAIGGSEDYNDQVRTLTLAGGGRDAIYQDVVVDDISQAADIFRPVYDKTGGVDGFVSLEVSPVLAHDTNGTIEEAKKLFARLERRKNVMIKIPATPEGLPAIEAAIADGINVNVTLIFSNDVYRDVAEAYIRGLERRAAEGLPLGEIRSVASFFVSRIDSLIDKQLGEKIAASQDETERKELEGLLGKVAIANAKLAYQTFKEIFSSERFRKLPDANAQRQLWASTGTKNPKFSDTYYVEALIGPDTVDTIPPATYAAFRDHGTVRLTLEEGLDEARQIIERLDASGVSLMKATEQLTAEGVKSFAASFESLMNTIETRRTDALKPTGVKLTTTLGSYEQAVKATLERIDNEKWISRIWKQDPTVWKTDSAHTKIISNALGWLPVVADMEDELDEVVSFAEEVRGSFKDVVVLGMGGSSLCPEVLRKAFGTREGYPTLSVLDSTVPAAVKSLESRIDVAKTLFIVASKSGGTTEPQMFHRYFYSRVQQAKEGNPGENFIAITDPNTQLQKEATRDGFRKIFTNPADIGGRYSALSLFGMVPAALAGIDVRALIDRANEAARACARGDLSKNPGAQLGAILGTLAVAGRNKVTIFSPPPLDALGLWIEQLIAESTGKEGKGIVPVAATTVEPTATYAEDALFAYVHVRKEDRIGARVGELRSAGHPVVEQLLDDPLDLGTVFFTWEFAVAIAGAIVGINPFDQPNVQESKDNTKALLEEYRSNSRFTLPTLVAHDDALDVYAAEGGNGGSPDERISSLVGEVRPGDYVALLAYIEETPDHDKLLESLRSELAHGLRVATTVGYGPRFLHSTGQLHKGGADNGVFIQITADDREDVAIPDEPFTFGILKEAQSLGDFQSLTSRNRRALRVNLKGDTAAGLSRLLNSVQQATSAHSKG